jgi:hypothetical protein
MAPATPAARVHPSSRTGSRALPDSARAKRGAATSLQRNPRLNAAAGMTILSRHLLSEVGPGPGYGCKQLRALALLPLSCA